MMACSSHTTNGAEVTRSGDAPTPVTSLDSILAVAIILGATQDKSHNQYITLANNKFNIKFHTIFNHTMYSNSFIDQCEIKGKHKPW